MRRNASLIVNTLCMRKDAHMPASPIHCRRSPLKVTHNVNYIHTYIFISQLSKYSKIIIIIQLYGRTRVTSRIISQKAIIMTCIMNGNLWQHKMTVQTSYLINISFGNFRLLGFWMIWFVMACLNIHKCIMIFIDFL